MIQYSQMEKDLIKRAKKSFKQQNKVEKLQKIEFQKNSKESKRAILTGILEDEQELPDDYPVYFDYFYVISDDGGKVVRSNVQGNVLTLKKDLQKLRYKAEKIYSCNMLKRKFYGN